MIRARWNQRYDSAVFLCMNPKTYITRGLLHAGGVVLYVAGIASLFANAKIIFGEKEPEGIAIPIFMLLLFIISATITSLLVLGKPIQLYFGGSKQEAARLLFATIVWLVIAIVILGAAFLMI